MMNDTACPFDRREEALVAYAYGEIDATERERFERHLQDCAECRLDLSTLSEARAELGGWRSPEPAAGVGGRTSRAPWRVVDGPPQRGTSRTRTVPMWLQAAAAVFLAAASLGVANLRVTYSPDAGLAVSTGWMRGADRTAAPSVQPPTSPPATTPWQRDLASLEEELRAALKAEVTAIDASGDADLDEDALLRKVRALIAESERRQQRELALRVAEVAHEAQIQRQADLVKIDRSLGVIQSRTGVEVMRTQQQLNSLAQRVSQRP